MASRSPAPTRYVRLEVNGDELVARVPLAGRPAVGDRVRIAVDPATVHVFDAATGARVRR